MQDLKACFAPDTAKSTPLPSATPVLLTPWAAATTTLVSALPTEVLFPLVDMWRLIVLDPAAVAWLAAGPGSGPVGVFSHTACDALAATQPSQTTPQAAPSTSQQYCSTTFIMFTVTFVIFATLTNPASGLFVLPPNSHGSISPNITEAGTSSESLDPDTASAAGHLTTTTGDDITVAFANNTIDNTDSQNKFYGVWSVVPSDQAYGGLYRITNDPSVFVSSTFNGSAVYLLISQWTCGIALDVGLDAQPNIRLDLQDQSTPITANCVPVAPPQAFTIATDLSSTTHMLTIRTTPRLDTRARCRVLMIVDQS
ncbi:hypothetical protein DFH08DRAFT_1045583 [Mycena albidolilacea]|uniref:Uncharacterized protein n=1 Tax=Mycena albidolilacea TaxID=1033008 RepID=A0AAD6Z8L8_9AGAR|nr:hypothetical protein DFH08DRAFT_1045583 [Mycena albidolilacea]